MANVVWTEYLRYRARLRHFDLPTIEQIVRFSEERYFDTATQHVVAIGRHRGRLVMVPYESDNDSATPVTIHATTRQQIRFRVRTGRFRP